MKKMKKSKGFTLAELLIVVAIMAVLVGVAIPVFTAQLKKSQSAVDEANARSLYAELMSDYLANGNKHSSNLGTVANGKITADEVTGPGGNKYKFNHVAEVTVTLGEANKSAPKVEVSGEYVENGEITFGGTTIGS